MAKIKGTWSAEEAEKATATFEPLPAGDYLVEIIDSKDEKIKEGNQKGYTRRIWEFRVVESFDGENIGRKIGGFTNTVQLSTTWASGKTNFTFYQAHKAIGADDGEFPDAGDDIETVLGVTYGYNPPNAKGHVYNTVRSYFAPESKKLSARNEELPTAEPSTAASSTGDKDEFDLDSFTTGS